MGIIVTREEFDKMDSAMYQIEGMKNIPCPDCNECSTHPVNGCYCRQEFGGHVMKYHHNC